MNSALARSLAAALVLSVGCGLDDGVGGSDELRVVPAGKEDNYYSSIAAEFELEGSIPVRMTAEQFADEAVRQDLALRRVTAVGLYLTAYLTAKFRGIDENNDGQISDDEIFFFNEGYGDFSALVRNQSIDDLVVTGDAQAGYRTTFAIDVAGPRDLLTRIPAAPGVASSDTELTFDFQMPAGESIDPENVPRRQFRRFNPATYTGELETVRCTARPLPTVSNAYPQYAAFVSDGVFDITLFYGHDYNTSRSDLSEAGNAFSTLVDAGFEAPVATFEDLKADSGPFTRRASANGREIVIEVRIFHSNMFETARRVQHDLALSELVARDVFFYNGHAGPYYGFYLDESEMATVSYLEFEGAPFTDRQQLFVAQGCQTYSQYADMLYANPQKSEDNLDVITSVNYTYGRGTMELLENLIRLDENGNHVPTDFYRIVGDLNNDWLNAWRDVFYGVMGIEGNGQIHPYANLDAIGDECAEAIDCGDPHGNVCVALENGAPKRCGVVSLAEQACPEGTRFRQLAVGSTIEAGACLSDAPVTP